MLGPEEDEGPVAGWDGGTVARPWTGGVGAATEGDETTVHAVPDAPVEDGPGPAARGAAGAGAEGVTGVGGAAGKGAAAGAGAAPVG